MILVGIYNQQFQGRRINYVFLNGLWLPGYVVGGKNWLANHHTTKLRSDIWLKKWITLSTVLMIKSHHQISCENFPLLFQLHILILCSSGLRCPKLFDICPYPLLQHFHNYSAITKYLSPQPLSKENPMVFITSFSRKVISSNPHLYKAPPQKKTKKNAGKIRNRLRWIDSSKAPLAYKRNHICPGNLWNRSPGERGGCFCSKNEWFLGRKGRKGLAWL